MMLYVSKQRYKELQDEVRKKEMEKYEPCSSCGRRDKIGSMFSTMYSLGLDPLMGQNIIVSDALPRKVKTGRIIQKDPFAEYEEQDMKWAEPAGLAEWEMKEEHSYEIPDRLFTHSFYDFMPELHFPMLVATYVY